MPLLMCQTDSPRYCGLFPDWEKPRPIRFFFMENLLETRNGSVFPTGSVGFDEDVNVYISHLLANFLRGTPQSAPIKWGAGPLLEPPEKTLPMASQIEYYRVNADHRLLHLGLMNRGDGIRRNRNPLQRTEATTRGQDLMVGSTCYGMAANLLQHGNKGNDGLAEVMRKLEKNFTEYVQVVAALATSRLHLGAQLSESDLQELIQVANPNLDTLYETPTSPEMNHTFSMDDLLDMMLAQKEDPQPQRHHLIKDMARQLGVPGHLLMEKAED